MRLKRRAATAGPGLSTLRHLFRSFDFEQLDIKNQD